MASQNTLMPLVHKLFEVNALAAANTLETMKDEEAVGVLKKVSPKLISKTLVHLPENFSARLLIQLPAETFSEILKKLEPQQRTTLFRTIPEERKEAFLKLLDEKEKKEIQELLTYPDDSIGKIMSTDFIAFNQDLQIGDSIQKIRRLASKGFPASYIYVVDSEQHLVGVINMRDLMLASSSSHLKEIMKKDIFSLEGFLEKEKAALQLAQRKYFACPVVDSEKRLLGVIKAEQLLGGIQEAASEDIQRMFGAGGDERVTSTIWFALRKRLPWLHVNLVTAFMAASVVALFEDIIAKITVLAVFLPVVAGQGGNAGAQSLAIVMRGLVMREIPKGSAKKLIIKEAVVGAFNGVIIGIVTGLIAWVWYKNYYLGVVIGLGMLVNLVIAGLAGTTIPLIMKKVGLDPAQCSNIILTTVTDVMGFFAFLGFAVLFQKHLI